MNRFRGLRLANRIALALTLLVSGQSALAHQGDQQRIRPPHATQEGAQAEADRATIEAHEMTVDSMADLDMASEVLTWPKEGDRPADDGGGMVMGRRTAPATFGGRLIAWLGAWHPAVIHFPIALPLTAVFLELLAWLRREPIYVANNQILLGLGALGAFVAAGFGWAGAGLPAAEDQWALMAHRWLGSLVPLLILVLWNMGRIAVRAESGRRSRAYYVIFGVTVVVLLGQGFLGGEVTHGANHMAF